jgi:hypothetical protein
MISTSIWSETMRSFHLSDKPGRDAYLRIVPSPATVEPIRAARGSPVGLRRFVVAGESCTHEALTARFGADYGDALLESDPEVDLAITGSPLPDTVTVYLTAAGELSVSAPRIVEVVTGPGGAERERREPIDVAGNVDLSEPIRLSKFRFKRADAIRRFAFARSLVVSHVDGLTFEFLRGLAEELDRADELVMVGAGAAGREPLVLQQNGVPWRGFLEGRIDGDRHSLVLRLSNMELKMPEVQDDE